MVIQSLKILESIKRILIIVMLVFAVIRTLPFYGENFLAYDEWMNRIGMILLLLLLSIKEIICWLNKDAPSGLIKGNYKLTVTVAIALIGVSIWIIIAGLVNVENVIYFGFLIVGLLSEIIRITCRREM